jgi:hypothetical protein
MVPYYMPLFLRQEKNIMAKVIGFTGSIGSGKDTAADYLCNFHEFKRDSFASTLKDAVAAVFNWDRELLEGRTKASREWREQRDAWWSERLGMPITPRWVLQNWGTEVCRIGFHDDIWIASLENKLRQTTDDIVISDVRFPNEIRSIKNQNGIMVRVKRGPDADWFPIAVRANNGDISAIQELKVLGVHASEYSWVGAEFTTVIENDGTIQELYDKIEDLLKE